MKNLSFFEIGLLIVFVFLGIVAILIFSGVLPGLEKREVGVGGTVVLWGTMPSNNVTEWLSVIKKADEPPYSITYVEKNPERFDEELVDALASGTGPDMIILTTDLLVRHENKIYPLSLEQYPLRTFYDSFIDGATIFIAPTGILALPLVVDPLMLYYNKDALGRGGYAEPPLYWSQLVDRTSGTSPIERLTVVDERGNVLESAIGLGTYGNVRHAKSILSLLILQAGGSITERSERGSVVSRLGVDQGDVPSINSVAALNFFTQFSNPTRTTYTWNSALPDSRILFGTGKLALYLGFASEKAELSMQNPHLFFDVAEVPQRDSMRKVTTGRLYGLAVMKQSRNRLTAQRAQVLLSGAVSSEVLADQLRISSARKDVLSRAHRDPFMTMYRRSAITVRTWLDPDARVSEGIFGTMVQSVLSGQVDASQALRRARTELAEAL